MKNSLILYLKESPFGKKYLGKTTSKYDPYHYSGSGIKWKAHLAKHKILPSELKTTILLETEDKEEFRKVALEYSAEWDVVNNPEFCNLTVEEGQGGDTSALIDYSKRNTFNPNPKGTKGFRKGQVWMFKGKTQKRVVPEEISSYLKRGYKEGYIIERESKNKKTKWMFKGKHTIRAHSSEVDSYLEQGYQFGTNR